MQLYLIRHPRPAVAPGICYGRTDLGLADDAAACARRLAPLLPARAPVYTSPLERCRALAAALHASPRIDARLQEMHFGAWEMQPWDRIDRAALDAWAAAPLHYAPPGGESVAALGRRVLAFIGELGAAGHEAAVLVTHAGVMKVVAARVRDLPETEWLGLRFDYGELVRMVWSDAQIARSQW
ncbi:alpha-ribazole phosphatase [Denitratisoma sp. DHT3]|uniref:alpha-ribazole phosphatase n=1 Tax=Denitratisoma sp. DHT3 TaxID=1981880 RepID=UPI001198A312|nr:alpha-ribazole phosphatase [Denitratisoma sp. DHT3]QDX82277.1 alpha-ribazole phosphatase [Denitratisoma sp. DHT3]